MTSPVRPTGLGMRGARLWRDVVAKYDGNPAQLELLAEAARCCDTIDALRARLDASELVVKGSMGQERVNPLAVSLMAAQTTLRQLLAAIGLPDIEEIPEPKPSKLMELRAARARNRAS